MANEILKAFKLRNLDVLIGKKIKIAEMDHAIDTPNGLFSKRLLAKLELRSPEEIKNDPIYQKRITDSEKELSKHQAGWNIIKRIQANKVAKEKEISQKIEQIEENVPEQISAFVVKEYERVVYFQHGILIDVLLPGAYEIDPEYQSSATEIVWVDMTEFQFQWGFGDILTQDYATVGVHGLAIFHITDPKKFIMTITSGKKDVNQEEIENYIIESVRAAFKNEMSKLPVETLLHKRETIETAIHSAILNSIQKWGLELVGLHISGMKLPPEVEQLQKQLLDAKIKKESISSMAQISLVELDNKKTLEVAEQNKSHLLELQKQQQELERQKQQLEIEKHKQEIELIKMKQEIDKTKTDAKKPENVSELKPSESLNVIPISVSETKPELKKETEVIKTEPIKVEPVKNVPIAVISDSAKIDALTIEMKEKDQQLVNMDKMLMSGQISKELYELRSRLIINQLEDLRKEMVALRKV